MVGRSYSSSSQISSGYSGAKTTSSKKSSSTKTTSRPNPHTGSGSSTTSVATSSQIKSSAQKTALATGQSQLNNYQVPKADTPFFFIKFRFEYGSRFKTKNI